MFRHAARLAPGLVIASLAAGCSTPVAPPRAQPRDSVVSALGVAGSRAGSERRTLRVEGRRNELSVEVPAEWTVGSPTQLDQIDNDNRNRAEHFLLAEVVAMDTRAGGESMMVVSVRRPPAFTAESIASTSVEDIGEANAQLLREAGVAQAALSAVGPINVAQWSLRQIDVNGQSMRCLEMSILSRIGGDQAHGDLTMHRTLYIPQPLAEVRVQMSYRIGEENLKLSMMRAAVSSLRF